MVEEVLPAAAALRLDGAAGRERRRAGPELEAAARAGAEVLAGRLRAVSRSRRRLPGLGMANLLA